MLHRLGSVRGGEGLDVCFAGGDRVDGLPADLQAQQVRASVPGPSAVR
jgi:hypothetical protein